MKRSRIHDINTRITEFYKEYMVVAREWKQKHVNETKTRYKLRGYNKKQLEGALKCYKRISGWIGMFQSSLADTFYENDEHSMLRARMKKAAEKCGFELAGAGRTRVALSIEYNSETVVVKLSPCGENDTEIKHIETVLYEGSDEMKKVMLTPSYIWKHRNWGTVLVFPKAKSFGNDWDIHHARFENWSRCGLPTELHNEETVDRLDVIKEKFDDVHEWNIGFVDNLPYIIDVNFGVRV